MSSLLSEDKLQEIRDRIDLVELVSSYLPLKNAGRNHLGLCPFHQEKTPSFNVSPEKQIYKCFGCGVSGDLFEFVMKMEGLSFPEAARRLADRAGVELNEEPLTPEEEQRNREREHLLRINEVACAYYQQQLLESPQAEGARRYLKKRGYDRQMAETYRLGFAPDGWENLSRHLADQGFDATKVRQLGLIRTGKEGRGDYDLFRKRLIFPIVGLKGEVLAFGARVLDDSLPKYINSTDSPVYHKGRILFGLHTGRQAMRTSGEAIVVEGYFDQMALHRVGYPQSVATCGTALTEEHAALLKRYAKKVFLLFDQDAAGQKATFRAMEPLLALGVETRVVQLPSGEDPDSLLASSGAEGFQQRMAESTPVVEAFVDFALAQEDASVEGRVRAAHAVMDKLALVPDAMTRGLYTRMLAERIGVDEALLKQYRPKVPRSVGRQPAHASVPTAPPSTHVPPPEAPPPQDGDYAGAFDRPDVYVPPPRSAEPVRADVTKPVTVQSRAQVLAQRDVLRLMLALPRARQQVIEQGPALFFVDADLLALGQVLTQQPSEPEQVEPSALLDGLSASQQALLHEVAALALEPLLEDPDKHLQDCQQKVAVTRRNEEAETLRAQIEAMPDGDAKNDALQRLISLKKR